MRLEDGKNAILFIITKQGVLFLKFLVFFLPNSIAFDIVGKIILSKIKT
jgi:hypothetical protein